MEQSTIQDNQGLQKLLQNICNADKGLKYEQKEQKIWSKVISLVGITKAGKTTSMLYMAGHKLRKTIDKQNGNVQIEQQNQVQTQQQDEKQMFLYKIGHGYQSQTVYPNILTTEGSTIIDNPGFRENRHFAKIPVMYITKETMKKIKQVYFVLVIPYEIQGQALLIAETIRDFRNMLTPQLQELASQHLSILLTKHDSSDDKDTFLQRIQEIQGDQDDEGSLYNQHKFVKDAIDQGRVFEFTSDQPSTEDGIALRTDIQSFPFLDIEDKEIINLKCLLNDDQSQQTFKGYLQRIIEEVIKEVKIYTRAILSALLMMEARMIEDSQKFEEYRETFTAAMREIHIHPDQAKYQDYVMPEVQLGEFSEDDSKKLLELMNQILLDYALNFKYSSSTIRHFNGFLSDRIAGMISITGQQLAPLQIIKENIQYINKVLHIAQDLLSQFQAVPKIAQEKFDVISELAKKIHNQSFPKFLLQEIQEKFDDLSNFDKLQALCDELEQQNQQNAMRNDNSLDTDASSLDKYNFKPADFRVKQKVVGEKELKVEKLKRLDHESLMNLPRTTAKLEVLLIKLFPDWKFETNHQRASMETKMQRQMIRQISWILERGGLYEEAILFLLVIKDFESIEVLIQEGFNLRKAIGLQFIMFLAESCAADLRQELAIRCYNQLISQSESRQEFIHYGSQMQSKIFDRYEARKSELNKRIKQGIGLNNLNYSYLKPREESDYRPPQPKEIIEKASKAENQYRKINFREAFEKFMRQNNQKCWTLTD